MTKPIGNYNICVAGLNHKTSTLETRESISFSPSKREDALKKLKILYPSNEYIILSTCNRVEIYIGNIKEKICLYDIMDFLSSYHNIPEKDIAPFIYTYYGDKALMHLFEVAAGIDSLVIGETQILGQMKNSYRQAFELGLTDKVLNMAFQKAFAVGKKVRSLTKISNGNVSISSVSCQLAVEVLKGLREKKVLLIGAGKIGTMTLRSLRDRGANTILVSSRNYEKAKVLAEEFNGRAVRFEELDKFMVWADLVISATSAPHYILTQDRLKRIMAKRKNKSILLIDLAVPRDIDPSISQIRGIELYNIDSLKKIAARNMEKRKKEIFRCKEIIDRDVEFFIKELNPAPARRDGAPEEKDDRLFNALMPRKGKSHPSSLYKDKIPCHSLESYIEV